MAAKVYYEADADPSIIRGRKVAIIGYGSQGHAHALNLKESGVPRRRGPARGIALGRQGRGRRAGGALHRRGGEVGGHRMMTMPDTEQKATYDNDIKQHMKKGKAIAFAHGFNIRFKRIRRRRRST
jgi:ketol-acid reductoisomerase